MKELTKAEEQLMRILWKLEKAFLKDVVEEFPEPKPAYTTISTVMRVLVKKGIIGYETFGKTNRYYPILKESTYYKDHVNKVIKNFFGGSVNRFASFFTENQQLKLEELEDVKRLLEEKIEDLKQKND